MKWLIIMLLCPWACFAQHKYNGDWKGEFYSKYSNRNFELVLHIQDGRCSQEPAAGSPGGVRQERRFIVETEDSVKVYDSDKPERLLLRAELVKDQLVGEFYIGDEHQKVILKKFGPGTVTLEKNYKRRGSFVGY